MAAEVWAGGKSAGSSMKEKEGARARGPGGDERERGWLERDRCNDKQIGYIGKGKGGHEGSNVYSFASNKGGNNRIICNQRDCYKKDVPGFPG